MSVTKRTRYEVLRRDNHACRYCGAGAPDATLTVDHVVPVSLGGSDAPSNLVAACRDCNAGKSSSAPDAELVEDVSRDALLYVEALKLAAAELDKDIKAREKYRKAFLRAWREHDPSDSVLDGSYIGTVARWQAAQMPIALVTEAVHIAWGKSRLWDRDRYRYMAGIVWARLTEMQEVAAAAAGVAEWKCRYCDGEDCVYHPDDEGCGQCENRREDHTICCAEYHGEIQGWQACASWVDSWPRSEYARGLRAGSIGFDLVAAFIDRDPRRLLGHVKRHLGIPSAGPASATAI